MNEVYQSDVKQIFDILDYEISHRKRARISIVATVQFQKLALDENNDEQVIIIPMRAKSVLFITFSDKDRFVKESLSQIQNRMDDFAENGSDWIVETVLHSEIEIGTCRRMDGKCGAGNIVMKSAYGTQLSRLKSNSNKTKDCFLKAIAYHFIRSEKETKLKEFIKKHISLNKIEIPMEVKNIAKFERINEQLDCRINIIARETFYYPLYCSPNIDNKQVINLLLIEAFCPIRKRVISHYLYIQDLGKLLRKRYEGKGGRKSYEKLIICENCFNRFGCDSAYTNHIKACILNSPQIVRLPPQCGSDILEFTNFKNQFISPVIGFYDFESVPKEYEVKCTKCQNQRKCKHKTIRESRQHPISYVLLFMTRSGEILHCSTYLGNDCIKHFLLQLQFLECELESEVRKYREIDLSTIELTKYHTAKYCHICTEPIDENPERGMYRVMDHDHHNGEFLGAAHCKLNCPSHDILRSLAVSYNYLFLILLIFSFIEGV